MAAKPNIKFMSWGSGGVAVHVVTTKREDMKHSKCPTVKKGHQNGHWRGKGLSPEAALSLKPCSRCSTAEVAEAERKSRMTPAQKRAETLAQRDETMRKSTRGSTNKKRYAKVKVKPAKRRGPKGGDPNAKMKANVEEHATLAKKHGWKATAKETGVNEWTCEATKGGETLKLIYRDGRTVWARVVLASGVEVRLRNSSNWRKHAMGESKIKAGYTPRSNGGKKAARKEVIADDADSRGRLNFDPVEDDDDTIIESLVGKRISWRNSLSKTLDSAIVPVRSRNVRVTVHPKSGRRIVSFYESQGFSKDREGETAEALGGERSVYLDKILKVR